VTSNGDGTSDILLANANGGIGQFVIHNSVSTWTGIGAVGAGWQVARTGDFNGDETSDILLAKANGGIGQ
jgi:hypothetical protein